jgi:hypothetical protein
MAAYYDVVEGADCAPDALPDVAAAVVLDMHGVVDLLRPAEFDGLVAAIRRPVYILSDLYSRDVLDTAVAHIRPYCTNVAGAYACFSIADTPGNKCWFLQRFADHVLFVDDDLRHIGPTRSVPTVTAKHLTQRHKQLTTILRAAGRGQYQ